MIAVILVLTVVTSLKRNDDLQQVHLMSELQREANHMLDNFNLARIEIRTVFTSIDAEDEYGIAVQYLSECTEHLGEMESLSSQMGAIFRETLNPCGRCLRTWKKG